MLCDGNPDCHDNEDEHLCEAYQCAGGLHCRKDGLCAHSTDACDGVVLCLMSGDNEMLCDMSPCHVQSCVHLVGHNHQ